MHRFASICVHRFASISAFLFCIDLHRFASICIDSHRFASIRIGRTECVFCGEFLQYLFASIRIDLHRFASIRIDLHRFSMYKKDATYIQAKQ